MSEEKKSVSTSFDTVYTAEEVNREPIYCPYCKKAKTWRRLMFPLSETIITIRCECEVEADRKADEDERQRQKRQRIDNLFKYSQLGERFKNCTFENWEHSKETEPAYQTMKSYADNFSRDIKDGLCLYGVVGCGKSHLAAAVVNQLVSDGYSAIFQDVPSLLTKIRATYNSSGESENDIFRALSSADLLVLDDAGAEKPTEWVKETLYTIINKRYSEYMPIIITTNAKDMIGLSDVFGFRAYDRILEICAPVKFDPEVKSYRRKIAIKNLEGKNDRPRI